MPRVGQHARTWLTFLAVALVTVTLGSWPDREWRTLDLPVRTLALPARGTAPLVILVQGAHLPPEFLRDPACDLARRGFRVALVDLWTAADPAAALAQAAAAESRGGPVALYAHSLGAQPALAFACAGDRLPGALAVLGWDPTGPRGRPAPRNLLLAYGRFDDYVGLEEIAASLAQVAPGPAPRGPGQTTGNLADGTARRLVVAPWSQHGGEPFDPVLLDEAAAWFAGAFGMPVPPRPVTVALRHPLLLAVLALLLAWLAWRRPAGVPIAVGVLALGLVAGLVPALPGVALLLGLLLVALGEPRAPRHLLALLVGVNVAVLAHAPGRFGAVALYEVLFLPSQAHGLLSYWQACGPWPWWALLGGLGTAAALVLLAPDLVRGWLARWTRFVGRWEVLGALAALALWLPPFAGVLAYALLVR